MNRYLDQAIGRLKAWRHRRVARGVLRTAPAQPHDDGVVIFSMIGHRVVLPYLVAAKSLHHHLGRGRFAAMDDGTLTDADRATIAHHLPGIRFLHLDDVDTRPCPRGGTWERLLAILDLRADAYVIQLDSDTVTLGPVPEVAAAIDGARGFTLLGDTRAAALGVMRASEFTAAHSPDLSAARASGHVQTMIEAALPEVEIPNLCYVRGCSGFAGFAPNADGRALAERFSGEAERLIGAAKWRAWGSEQVTSNVVVANSADPLALPYDRYTNYWAEPLAPAVAFAHFIGTYRFHDGAYMAATRAAIAALPSV